MSNRADQKMFDAYKMECSKRAELAIKNHSRINAAKILSMAMSKFYKEKDAHKKDIVMLLCASIMVDEFLNVQQEETQEKVSGLMEIIARKVNGQTTQ